MSSALRTNGWTQGNILSLVTIESAYLGLLAGLAGAGLAFLAVAIANQFLSGGIHLTIPPALFALGVGLSVVTGTLGGSVPRLACRSTVRWMRFGSGRTEIVERPANRVSPSPAKLRMPMIEVVNVKKSYKSGDRQVEALRGVDCRIAKGRFAFIVGPSGSGKSTLLYLLGALDRPTEGEIHVEGLNLSTMSEAEANTYSATRSGSSSSRLT